MVRGELPNKKFYSIPETTSQLGAGDINVVSPTQQAVEQAKMAVKRKLEFPSRQVRAKKRRTSMTPRTSKKRKAPKKKSKKPKKVVKKTIKRVVKKNRAQSKSKPSRVKTSNKLKCM